MHINAEKESIGLPFWANQDHKKHILVNQGRKKNKPNN